MKHVKLISTSTISKYTKNVSALFNWEIKQGYTRDNVFQGKLESTRKKQVIESFSKKIKGIDIQDGYINLELNACYSCADIILEFMEQAYRSALEVYPYEY